MKSVLAYPARVAVLAAVLLLSACSVLQMVYSQAPRYVQWRTNVAHHFTTEQYRLVTSAVHQWFAWHRQTQLSDYAGLPIPPEMTGQSFAPLLRGAPFTPRTHLFAQRGPHASSLPGTSSSFDLGRVVVTPTHPPKSPQNHSRSSSSGSKPSKGSCVKLVSLPNIIPKLQNHSLEPLRSRLSPSKLSLSSSDWLGS